MKGDTLFGHFCWQVVHHPELVKGGLESVINSYSERPFVIFSSAFPRLEGPKQGDVIYLFPRPSVPISWFIDDTYPSRLERYKAAEKIKERRWLRGDKGFRVELKAQSLLDEAAVREELRHRVSWIGQNGLSRPVAGGLSVVVGQAHNTINRLTGTTGTGEFAPFSKDDTWFLPGVELALFVLVDQEQTSIEKVRKGLEEIGRLGFGRDASTGLGRFEVTKHERIEISQEPGLNACYTLSPCVPEMAGVKDLYFTPFVRFGKHGDYMAVGGNPFKNPVIFADEGAVLVPKDDSLFVRPYVGRAIGGLSKQEPATVTQGYAPYLPLRLEG